MVETDCHYCPNCKKEHDFDKFTSPAESFSDEFFPNVWKEGKDHMKSMSKKKVAEQMYFLGVKHFMEEVHNRIGKAVEKTKKL
jgi:hypothetical protein